MQKPSNRKLIVGGLLVLTAAYVGIFQNCSGSNERSSDFSISSAQVQTYIQDLQCAAASATNTDEVSAINNLSTYAAASGSELFYSEAPSGMGPVDVVAPLQYPTLRADNGGTPSQLYAFFVLTSSGQASLAIGIVDSTSSTATATSTSTTGTTAVAVKNKMKSMVFAKSHALDSTTGTTATCSTTNPLGLTTAIAAQNDGTTNLEPPTFTSDGVFEMQLLLDGSIYLQVRSYDVDNGDLQSTIQLEISQIDINSGTETYLGDLNLTQPD